MTTLANEITGANAGERSQFRFAADAGWSRVAELDVRLLDRAL